MRPKVVRSLAIAFAVCVAVIWLYMADTTGWYAELKSWQTGIGAFLGMFALMVAALYNAKLVRKRDDYLREREARGLANVLAIDIDLVHAELAALTMQLDRVIAGDVSQFSSFRPISNFSPHWSSRESARLSHLPADLITAVRLVLDAFEDLRAYYEREFSPPSPDETVPREFAVELKLMLSIPIRQARVLVPALVEYAEGGTVKANLRHQMMRMVHPPIA